METKETGEEAPKAAEAPPEAAKSGEASPAEGTTKPADDEAAKPAEAPAGASAEAPANAGPALAQAEPLAPVPNPRGTYAGVAALVILLGGVLGTILIARHNEAAHNKAPTQQKKKGPKKDTTPWNVGDKMPVVITVVGEDTENLVCAAKEEIGGKHCAFENKDTPWSKDDSTDDKILLRPFATTGQRRLIAAGFWSQLPTPLPTQRFSVKCTFAIEGKLDHPWVKFKKTMEFKEVKEAWFGGTLTDCSIVNQPGAGGSAHPSAEPAASAAPSAAPK
jgi:hypothetical protein